MWQWPGRVTIVESLASTRTWVPIPALGPKLCDAGHPSTDGDMRSALPRKGLGLCPEHSRCPRSGTAVVVFVLQRSRKQDREAEEDLRPKYQPCGARGAVEG